MNRHTLDPVSLVAGLVFAAVAVIYLVQAHTSVDVDGRWVLPLALIGLGVAGVLGALNSAARQRREGPTDDDDATPTSRRDADEPTAL